MEVYSKILKRPISKEEFDKYFEIVDSSSQCWDKNDKSTYILRYEILDDKVKVRQRDVYWRNGKAISNRDFSLKTLTKSQALKQINKTIKDRSYFDEEENGGYGVTAYGMPKGKCVLPKREKPHVKIYKKKMVLK